MAVIPGRPERTNKRGATVPAVPEKTRVNWEIAYHDEDLDHTFVSRYQECHQNLIPIFNYFFRLPGDENGVLLPSEQEVVLDSMGLDERDDEPLREFIRDCWHEMAIERNSCRIEHQKLQHAKWDAAREERESKSPKSR